jgi:hypothetical protein
MESGTDSLGITSIRAMSEKFQILIWAYLFKELDLVRY